MTGEGFTGTLREGKEVLVKVQSEDSAWVANRLGNIGITGDTYCLFVVIVVIIIAFTGVITVNMLLSFIIIIIIIRIIFNLYLMALYEQDRRSKSCLTAEGRCAVL